MRERGGLSMPDLIELLLAEQQQLTAVERFAHAHENGVPAQAKYYSSLLPAQPPGEGQQYAFEVDLDRCSGCKSCVTACHSLNGLDEQETWRDVGLLVGGTSFLPVMQHVTTACHHCLEPACLSACPVDAYVKDLATGIVKHLDDQCFGCQYCTLACPYDVPKYHHDKGIVRKCDLCADRLAVGEAPACVQACPNGAIAISIVNVAHVRENAEADPFLPAAPEPHLTFPTTTYKTSRVFPRNMLPADYHAVSPQRPHWPLIIMLVLTQLSVGAIATGIVLEMVVDTSSLAAFHKLHAAKALLFGLTALAASTLHLGRPQYAFRAIIGLRHSWLSREIVAFGVFAAAAMVYAGLNWLPNVPEGLRQLAGQMAVLTGALGIFCSAMIYVFTRREFWSFGPTMIKFVLTSIVLGIAATWLSLLLLAVFIDPAAGQVLMAQIGPGLIHAIVPVCLAKLNFEALLLRHLASPRNSPLKRSARLLVGPLANHTFARFAAGLLGGVLMPLFLLGKSGGDSLGDVATVVMVAMIFAACLAGELLERYQFFAAVAAPRMPGALQP